MAETLKSSSSFVAILPGASASLAHNLQAPNGTKLVPDVITLDPASNFSATADDTNVTVTNQSGQTASVNALCESWHTLERAFGANTQTSLVPQPFVVGGAGSVASGVGTIIYGSGQDGVAVFDGVNVFSFANLVGTTYTLNRDIFLSGGSVAVGITVASGGFKGFCNGRFVNNGVISADGKAAVGGVAGAASALGTLGVGAAGGAGRANLTGVAGSGAPGTNTLGDANLVGGAGGAGGANAGGAGGTYVTSATNGGANFLTPMQTGFLFMQQTGGISASINIMSGGSGGGGGGSNNAGVTGGGGGGGGGVLIWHVYDFVNNGIVRALGGNGAAAAGAGGDGGGGGGGAGGLINSLSFQRSGSGTFVVTGGTGGAAFGAGVAGSPGHDGHANLFFAA